MVCSHFRKLWLGRILACSAAPHRTHPHLQPRLRRNHNQPVEAEGSRMAVQQNVEARLRDAELRGCGLRAFAPRYGMSGDDFDKSAAQAAVRREFSRPTFTECKGYLYQSQYIITAERQPVTRFRQNECLRLTERRDH